MAKNYVKTGERRTFTAAANVASGQAVVLGADLGVALTAVAQGAQGEAALEDVWELPCLAGADIAANDRLIWDISAGQFIKASPASGDLLNCATADAPAGTGVTTVRARLTPGAGTIQGGGG